MKFVVVTLLEVFILLTLITQIMLPLLVPDKLKLFWFFRKSTPETETPSQDPAIKDLKAKAKSAAKTRSEVEKKVRKVEKDLSDVKQILH